MAYLGNSPETLTVLRVEARKSFALGLYLTNHKGRPLNLEGCTITMVVKPYPIDTVSDLSNLIGAGGRATVVPLAGYAQFNIQAVSLDHKPGEYDYSITLRTPNGYSSVIVKGILVLLPNTEVESITKTFHLAQAPQNLTKQLHQANILYIRVSHESAPNLGEVVDHVVWAPTGGNPGEVLTKVNAGDDSMEWRPVGNGEFALDATGQPEGDVPTAQGDDTWDWGTVSTEKSDWAAVPGSEQEILNKPTLGTAAAKDEGDFLGKDQILDTLSTVHFQSTIPSTGEDGHLYFVFL